MPAAVRNVENQSATHIYKCARLNLKKKKKQISL